MPGIAVAGAHRLNACGAVIDDDMHHRHAVAAACGGGDEFRQSDAGCIGGSLPRVAVARFGIQRCKCSAAGVPLAQCPAVAAFALDGVVADNARRHIGEPIDCVGQRHAVVSDVGVVDRHSVIHQGERLRTVVVPMQTCARFGHMVGCSKQRRQAAIGIHHHKLLSQEG